MREGERLASPSVGIWEPSIGVGAPLVAGMRLGRLRRAGTWLEVDAPSGVHGVALRVCAAGTWVAFGEPLVTMGAGGLAAEVEEQAAADPDAPPAGVTAVRAETDGTIYLRADPASPAFVEQGGEVAAKDTLALVEVMKTFNPVRSPIGGTVDRVCVTDGASVAQGEALFWVRSA